MTQNTAPAAEKWTQPRAPASQHHRRYLMCRPEHFTVSYTINPWMEPANPTDTAVAVRQWQDLYDTYIALGHEVELIDPIEGLPDMVYTANGGFLIDGVAYGAKFRFQERAGEAGRSSTGSAPTASTVVEPVEVNEGEGDFLLVGDTILAGTGFRSTGDSHREIGEVFGKEVVSLTLIDPRFYHLDTAIAVLDPVEGVANGVPSGRTSPTCRRRSTRAARRSSPSATPTRSTSPTKTARSSASTRPATGSTSSSRRARRASRRSCASAATTRCSSTCPSSCSAAAASSAAPSSCAERCHDHAADARRQHVGHHHRRRRARRAQLPPAARRDRARRGRVGHRRRGQALPRPALRVLGAQLRPRASGDPRRRAGAARPPHAHQPRVPQRPARRLRRGARRAVRQGPRPADEHRRRGGRDRHQGRPRVGLPRQGHRPGPRRRSSSRTATSTAARPRSSASATTRRRATTSDRSRPGSSPVPFGDAAALEAAIDDEHRRRAHRADPGRGRRRPAARGIPARGARDLHSATTCCSSPTRSSPASAAWARRSRATAKASCPTSICSARRWAAASCPLSAVVANRDVLGVIRPGEHGSTFGGNPLAAAVGTPRRRDAADRRVPAPRRGPRRAPRGEARELIGHGVTAVRVAGLWAGRRHRPGAGHGPRGRRAAARTRRARQGHARPDHPHRAAARRSARPSWTGPSSS